MTAPAKLCELIERFEAHRDAYKSDRYNEAQLREEFINPFFESLGWDVYNRRGYADAYKEVIHEAAIKIGGRTKAPDYCFRAGGGVRSFFVETKKPAVDIGEAVSPAYQLRRYAWSAKLPVSVLTDFEEFAVYDCRIRPSNTDKASVARALFLNYSDYAARWDELVELFSPEAIRRGSLERFVSSKKIKKGTAEVDAAFLDEIETWRNELARCFALRNPGLGQRDLNFAVGRTIDRIVFLRICEDRGVEPYGALQSLLNGTAVYRRLGELFQRADERYNSGLFHFSEERGRSGTPDELTLGLALDDEPLKEILRRLYFPDSPYEFSVFPAEILGQVYEQFLGKVIRLTAGHRAKVELKPEVRKAGGVYYTPSYIVDYIVRHTVGRLLGEEPVGKEPEPSSGAALAADGGDRPAGNGKKRFTPARAAKLRILDPACGSGSFLLGAYEYLLDRHRDWYIADGAEKHARGRNPTLYRSPSDEWRLTTAEKKRILLNNIHGVDIDAQAVEVTKLSLLLKVLEGESGETLDNQLRVFRERALPDLAGNIKCGNSLIGSDFYNGHQLSLFDEDDRWRLNVFDWKDEFPEVFNRPDGGFDAVIGNPPYVRIQTLNKTQPNAVEYFNRHYAASAKGNYDIYLLFVEKGFALLNNAGISGMVCPHKFFTAKYGESLRAHIADHKCLSHVVHFGHQQVFSNATTYTCLVFLNKRGAKRCSIKRIDDIEQWVETGECSTGFVPAVHIGKDAWNFQAGNGSRLMQKLKLMPTTLKTIAQRMAQGIRTSANEVYVVELASIKPRTISCRGPSGKFTLERETTKKFLQGRDIRRYALRRSSKAVLVPYELKDARMILMEENELRDKYPRTYKYLSKHKKRLQSREGGRMRRSDWYAYVYPKNLEIMSQRKILVPDIAERASFALDINGEYAYTSGYGITLKDAVPESDLYVLGLLNSALLDFFLKRVSTVIRGGYVRYFTQYIEQLPFRPIDFSDRKDKNRHDKMVQLVEAMLDLHKKLPKARTEHEKTVIERQINAIDRQIDRLVYELYDLTEEEIAVVEESAGKKTQPHSALGTQPQ